MQKVRYPKKIRLFESRIDGVGIKITGAFCNRLGWIKIVPQRVYKNVKSSFYTLKGVNIVFIYIFVPERV